MPLALVAVALVAVALAACDVHEFPQEAVEADTLVVDTRVDFCLRLAYDIDIPLYKEVTYQATRNSRAAQAADYTVRHLINVYQAASDGTYTRLHDHQFIVTQDDATQPLDTCLSLKLDEGTYKFIVWTDYVDVGTSTDKYYLTSDFAEVAIDVDEYEGTNEYRDAFRGTQEGTITAPAATDSLGETVDTIQVDMGRPMAKFEFVTTDLEEFIEKIAKRMAEENDDTRGTASYVNSVDLSAFTIAFAYTSYMPCSFNLFTDRPADSTTGMVFYGEIKELSTTQAQLGFDYVFVNTMATSVQVALYVFDSDGTQIASTDIITVPLMRSQLTTVYGAFLTSEATGGVGINPAFEGEYNIEIE